jgi:hypothetical protein
MHNYLNCQQENVTKMKLNDATIIFLLFFASTRESLASLFGVYRFGEF